MTATVPAKKRKKPGRKRGAPLTPAEQAQRQAAADRSTGPRTEEGKSRSSRNAWKHGQSSAMAKVTFAQNGAASMARMFGKPCVTSCPLHPDNPDVVYPCSLVVDGLTRAGGNCLDKTVYINALAALADAMENGELSGVHAMLAAEGGKVMQLLHELMREISTTGLMICIPMITKEGAVVYDRDGHIVAMDYKPNPMIPAYIKLLSDFGISLPEMLATPQARAKAKTGEQAADTFQTMMGAIFQRAGAPLPPAKTPPALEQDK